MASAPVTSKRAAGRLSLVCRAAWNTVLLAQEAQAQAQRVHTDTLSSPLTPSLQCRSGRNIPHLHSSAGTSGSAWSAGTATSGTRSPSAPGQCGGSSRSAHSALRGMTGRLAPARHARWDVHCGKAAALLTDPVKSECSHPAHALLTGSHRQQCSCLI